MDELVRPYDEYVEMLLKKYGPATEDYFTDDTYKQCGNYSRTMEGLICHHIDEDKVVLLSETGYLKKNKPPFKYQKADRLVYCNILEHMLLHMKIMEKELTKSPKDRNSTEAVGIGGFMCAVEDVNVAIQYNRGADFENYANWKKRCAKKIKGLDNSFFHAIQYFVEKVESRSDFRDWYGSLAPIDELLDFTHQIYDVNFGDHVFNQLFGDMF